MYSQLSTENLNHMMIEFSSNCNAMCPGCSRNIDGIKVHPDLTVGPAGNMSEDMFDKIVYNNYQKLTYIDIDGTYGDSLIHPKSFDYIEKLGSHLESIGRKNKVTLDISSNMGYNTAQWWNELGSMILHYFNPETSIVQAGLDGVDNASHQLYRKNVNFDKAIENCSGVISSGLKTGWKFIEFDHNIHLIDKAKEMAEHFGFSHFELRTNRNVPTLIHFKLKKQQVTENPTWTSKNKNKQSNQVKQMTDTAFKKLTKKAETVKQEDFSKVKCKWRTPKNKIMIDYKGDIHQCCFLSGYYNIAIQDKDNDYKKNYLDRYEAGWNSLANNQLDEILSHTYFSEDLPNSWSNSVDDVNNPLMHRCIAKCSVAHDKISKMR